MAGFQNSMGVLIEQRVTTIVRDGRQSVITKTETPVRTSRVDFT